MRLAQQVAGQAVTGTLTLQVMLQPLPMGLIQTQAIHLLETIHLTLVLVLEYPPKDSVGLAQAGLLVGMDLQI